MNFNELGLDKEMLQAIEKLGYEKPTPVQSEVIPVVFETQRDIIALAQTGTGKTAAFGLPVVQLVNPDVKGVKVIILSPTRELAIQISNDLKTFASDKKELSIVEVYGGAAITTQIAKLRKGADIVVGTPGRTLDLIRRNVLKLNNIQWLILDEADEMLNMGFIDDINEILEDTPETKRTLLFSATMPDGVRKISRNYLNNPVEITIGRKNTGAENIRHFYYVVSARDRYLALKRLVDYSPDIYGIIFCRTRSETKDVAAKLIDDGYDADALHGDLSQAQRDFVMKKFRNRKLQLLVATDVAARGLDIEDITHTINYNPPDDPEVYVHRSGRTGRAGKSGISMIITTPSGTKKIKEIEKLLGRNIEKRNVPTAREVIDKRLFNLIDGIENIIVDENEIEPYMDIINKKLAWLDREELLKRFIFVEFKRFLDYYKDAVDLNKKEKKVVEKSRRKARDFKRIFINIGTKNNLKPANLIGLINEATDSNNLKVGKIDIQRNFSFFEIEQGAEKFVIDSLSGMNFGSVRIKAELSESKGKKRSFKTRKRY